MANAIYPDYKQALLNRDANTSLSANTVKVALVDTGTYTYSATHTYYSDLSGVTANSAALTTKSVTDGIFDADSAQFTSVSGVESEALVLWIDTGNPTSDRLVAYIDTGVTGLPVTPNGGDITVNWNASGIFAI